MNILLERGALSCIGAWSGNANRGWSVEHWVCVERGAVKSNSLRALSKDAKIGWSAERWRPPNGPHKWHNDEKNPINKILKISFNQLRITLHLIITYATIEANISVYIFF